MRDLEFGRSLMGRNVLWSPIEPIRSLSCTSRAYLPSFFCTLVRESSNTLTVPHRFYLLVLLLTLSPSFVLIPSSFYPSCKKWPHIELPFCKCGLTIVLVSVPIVVGSRDSLFLMQRQSEYGI